MWTKVMLVIIRYCKHGVYLIIYPLGWHLSLPERIFLKYRRLCCSLIDWPICNGADPGKSNGHRSMLDVMTAGKYYTCLILYLDNFIIFVSSSFPCVLQEHTRLIIGVTAAVSYTNWANLLNLTHSNLGNRLQNPQWFEEVRQYKAKEQVSSFVLF